LEDLFLDFALARYREVRCHAVLPRLRKDTMESADFVLIILLVARFVGLYGFVFSEPIGRPAVWQVIFVVILFFDLSYFTHNSLADYAKIPTEFRMIGMKAATIGLVVLVNLFMFPQWLALYLYGFKRKNLWAKAS
jgi:hypothetical protein